MLRIITTRKLKKLKEGLKVVKDNIDSGKRKITKKLVNRLLKLIGG